MTITMQQLIGDIDRVRTNPPAIKRVVIDALEAASEGRYGLVDASNPFTFALEAAVAVGAAGIMQTEPLMRKLYPSMAQNMMDLYRHMSDEDYLDRFARPSEAVFRLALDIGEIKRRAVLGDNNVRRIILPRDTEFTIEGYSFTFQYPIEIRVMPHGGLQVMYDTSVLSPIEQLVSNQVSHYITKTPFDAGDLGRLEMLVMDIPLKQFKIEKHLDKTGARGFQRTFSFEDQFYHARVYMLSSDQSEWVEIHTTHNDQVYDPTKPTALLRVLENELMVDIPQIYFTQQQIERTIRVDIYVTKGQSDLLLERFAPNHYSVQWEDHSVHPDVAIAAIRAFGSMTLFSEDRLKGGHNGLTFEQMRERVIQNNLGNIQIPITPGQMVEYLGNLNYQLIKHVDNITDRIYLASRALPVPDASILSTAVGCTIGMLQASFNAMSGSYWVRDHNERMTIVSGAMFRIVDGRLHRVMDTEWQTFEQASLEQKVQLLLENRYVYTPFHYVLDSNNNKFTARAYYLDDPKVGSKLFVGDNSTTLLEIGSLRLGITKHDWGYLMTVITRTGEIAKGLDDDQWTPQLSFIPLNEVDRAYINGSLIGRTNDDEFIFEFRLETTCDITAQDGLMLTNFQMFENQFIPMATPLDAEFDLTYIVHDYSQPGMVDSPLDALQGRFLLDREGTVVIHEKVNVHLGTSLNTLWRNARSVASEEHYLKYTDNVYAYWPNTVYKRDEDDLIELERIVDPDTGEVTLEYVIEHQIGDPILDGAGNHEVLHYAGSVVRDVYGNPTLVAERQVDRQVDLLLFDAPYKFVTDPQITRYVKSTVTTLVRWMSEEIAQISERLLENTELWYYPQTTLGDVNVTVEDGLNSTIPADQSLRIRFYMNESAYNNLALRADLAQTATRVISQQLTNRKVSAIEMSLEIKAQTGNDVLDVKVSGLGGDADFDMLTINNASHQLNIRKRLVILPDETLTIQDDLMIEFIRHTR